MNNLKLQALLFSLKMPDIIWAFMQQEVDEYSVKGTCTLEILRTEAGFVVAY